DVEIHLTVATPEQAAQSANSRVTIPAKGLPAQRVPQPGETWTLRFATQEATAAEPAGAPTRPEP
ncbi:MAG: hypothetical protein K2X32_12910, partial [Phycisphaerales bacterium]|nr:hypothetical protein [Phycisphaerales bacterium]